MIEFWGHACDFRFEHNSFNVRHEKSFAFCNIIDCHLNSSVTCLGAQYFLYPMIILRPPVFFFSKFDAFYSVTPISVRKA